MRKARDNRNVYSRSLTEGMRLLQEQSLAMPEPEHDDAPAYPNDYAQAIATEQINLTVIAGSVPDAEKAIAAIMAQLSNSQQRLLANKVWRTTHDLNPIDQHQGS